MIRFVIMGEPAGKGRPKFFRRGNFVGTYTPEKTANRENLVKILWMEANKGGVWKKAEKGEAVGVAVHCWFKTPDSWSRKKTEEALKASWCGKKPDADNVGKLVCDALNGLAWDDDSQVVELLIRKRWCLDNPQTVVEIARLNEEA